ncbi:MAG: UPF0182 family protein [Euryarchaeota archaeon]|nr:UPF0182 family protein [Euryarchaeota archaeon]
MKGLKPTHVLVLVVVALFVAVGSMVGYYTDYLWFSAAGYSSIFLTILKWKILVILGLFLISFAFFYLNISFAEKVSKSILSSREISYESISRSIFLVGTAFVSFLFALSFSGNWRTILLYLNKNSFGVEDPIMSKDVSFYIFELPFWNMVRGLLLGLTFISILMIGILYFFRVGVVFRPERRMDSEDEPMDSKGEWDFSRREFGFGRDLLGKIPKGVMIHISALLSFFLGLIAFGFFLDRYELLFSTQGVVTGAGYTDVHVKLPILLILTVLAVLTAVAMIANVKLKDVRVPVAGMALILILFLAGSFVPGIYQSLKVEPNELQMEKEYLEHNIEYTRKGFGLSDVKESPFEVTKSLSSTDLENNKEVIENIRIWDRRVLKQTYKQLQQIRTYYSFNDVDTDRYHVNGDYRQYMISARELNIEGLASEARTWVNERLVYSHGFGLVMNPVSEKTANGQPNLVLKDIPPEGEFELTNPRVYYGELTGEYKIVNSGKEEFDYPKGAGNDFTNYGGNGGIKMDSFVKKMMYFVKFGEAKFFLSDYITGDSRLMYNRNVKERAKKIAPFLSYDNDPYPVVYNGKIFWIIDAYTTARTFPYSETYGSSIAGRGINYIRNSVKVVVDAYNGSVDFYMMSEEPIVKAYSKIFPDLFKPYETMPEGLKEHIRYPKDFFKIQMELYRTYHMTNPETFYNKEDAWEIPNELYRGSEMKMEPYYLITKLPNEEGLEYVLIQPLTPRGRDNMIAWVAARCDDPNYGELCHYEFSKGKLIYGPKQIEARVDQDPDISEQLTLWGQSGSNVIRGNLLVVPVGNSILYTEPIFISAEQSEIPELRRVVTSYGERVVMGEDLKNSLELLVAGVSLPEEEEKAQTAKELAKEALKHYGKAQEYLKEGDWTNYGKETDKVGELLDQLSEILEEEE